MFIEFVTPKDIIHQWKSFNYLYNQILYFSLSSDGKYSRAYLYFLYTFL